MADKIKGITVEIGGDTTKLSSALSKVNSTIRTTQTQLREVNKLLKLDPKNTDLLKEKQRLLEQQIGKTKDKLDALQQAQEKAKQQLAAGEIDQGAYDNLTKKVEKTKEELEKLEKEAGEVKSALSTSFKEAGEKITEAGEKITEAGEKLKGLSAAAAAGLGAAIKVTADFDSSMSKVAAVSGATGTDFDALRDKAREMGEQTKFSASEAADAMNYMAMAGWKTEDMLGGIEGIMNLAAASGEDLATTSDIVTDALTAFGLTAADSGHFADVLAAASSNANTNVSMMGETFKYAAPIAGALGYSVDDVAEAIGLMANSGVKGSQAGTSLRTIMQKLQGTLKLSSDAFGDMEIETANADGTMREFGDIIGDLREAFGQMTESEKAQAAETLVGKNAMSGFLAIMNAAPADIEKLSSAIAGADGTAASMAETMQDNLGGQLEILKSQLSELAISIGDTMMPTIREIVAKVQDVVDWLNSLDEETKTTIATVAAVVAALSPVLIIAGKLITAIGTIMTVINPVTIAIGALAGAMGYLALTATDAREEAAQLNEYEAATAETVNSMSESWQALAEARDEAVKAANEQAAKEEYLWGELQKITDENGNIIDGNEERAEFLAGELAEALGIEIDLVDGQIQKYEDLAAAVEEAIRQKKAQAILSANEAAYTEAVANQAEAYKAMKEAASEVAIEEARLADAEKDVADLVKERDAAIAEATKTAVNATDARRKEERVTAEYEGKIRQATEAVEGHKERLETLNGTLEDAEGVYSDYNSTIQNYEDLAAATVEGDQQKIDDAILKTSTGFKTATTATHDELVKQRDNLKATYEQMQKDMDEGAPGITDKQVAEAKRMYEMSEEELKKLPKSYSTAVKSSAQEAKTQAKAQRPGLQSELKAMTDMSSITSKSRGWGIDMVQNFIAGINTKKPVLQQTVNGLANLVKQTLGHSVPKTGPLKDELTWMPDMMQNLADGIEANKWRVLNEAQGLAADLRRTLNVSVTGGEMTANLNSRTVIEMDGRVVADVVNRQMGALV